MTSLPKKKEKKQTKNTKENKHFIEAVAYH